MRSGILTTVVVLLPILFAPCAAAQIAGSPHDFSKATWNASGDACIACHPDVENGADPARGPITATAAAYSVYASSTLNAFTGPPDGSSKMCLSCHDGSVASGAVASSGPSIGSDLRNDHPVSFVYDASLAATDGTLRDPSVAQSGLGSTIGEDLLPEGKMQCTSCHDPHSNRYGNFLIMPRAGDRLCITCHAK